MNVKDVIFDMHQGINTVADKVEYLNEGIPIIQSKNFTKGYLDLEDVRYLGKGDEEKYIGKYSPHVGDILMANIGTIGKSFVISEEEKFLIAWNVFLIKPNHKVVLSGFLKFYFDYLASTHYFDKLLTGGTVKFINKKKIGDIPFPKKDILEQQEIVKKLSAVENIVIARRKELEKLDELIKARFVELFGDTILNPFGWEKDSLGAVCDVRDGTHDSPKYYEKGYPLVTSKNVTGGKIDLTDCSLICEEDFNKINERSKVDIGDIIMPMIGTVGKPVIVDIEPSFAIKNVALIKFKADSRVLSIYIRALLQSDYFDDAVLSKVRGGTQKFISLGDIRKLEVLVPPMELQNQFTAFVEQVDKSKFVVQKALDESQLLFDSLMQKYFG